MLVIIVNAIMMSITIDGEAVALASSMEFVNIAFDVFFILEMCLTVMAVGARRYFFSKDFIIEAFVSFCSVAELILSIIMMQRGTKSDDASSFLLTSLVVVRLLRLFRLLRPWVALRSLFQSIESSFTEILSFLGLTTIYLFMMGLLGVVILRGRMVFDGKLSRNNFENVGWGMVTAFQCLTPENINNVVNDAYNAVGFGGAVFILVQLFIGHWVLEPLLLVIIVKNMDDSAVAEGKSSFLAKV